VNDCATLDSTTLYIQAVGQYRGATRALEISF
jgi:hypothetical protein